MKKSKFKAPDADVMLSDGSEKSLRDLWQSQTLVLVFFAAFWLTILPRAGGAVAPQQK